MPYRNCLRLTLFGFAYAGIVLVIPSAWAASPGACEKWFAKVVSAQGRVEARGPQQTAWRIAKLNEVFCHGDAIRTNARSRAALVLANETIVRLDQLTTLTLTNPEDNASFWLDLASGVAHFLSRTPRALKVKTPYVNAAVEGTEFVVRSDSSQASVTVLEGRVLAQNERGSVPLASGESATAAAGQAPVARLVAQPRDAVAWALYYPPLFDFRTLSGNAPWIEPLRRSAAAYLSGDINAAFDAIANVPNNIDDARFFNYRAGLLLSVGRLDEAQNDIKRSLELAAGNAHGIALQSIVALTRNEQREALDLARKASTSDPQSAPALIALSYAQQAAFDIEGARASTEQALQRDPENVLILARLSEIWLALGDLPRALSSADRAVALNPNVARTQSVLGFAYLTQIKTAAAKQAFEKAIAFDSADPLPRLGLGLALIRTGELEAGRREIEIAAALDPNNALIRSYLGKAYYEEKRNGLAATQLEMAKTLDPNDPTPWFYDAIRKQTENRPVEALRDLQKSIELNDNRAVYRSRLLLDQDLAARSASLARIYRSLGFNQRALVEGWRSVNADPSNHSAHRFLADAYASLPRHNIARVSELLQAQLLQPLNLHPLQPQLIESASYIPLELGPAASGYNEFNPLFTRERITAQLNTLVASNDTSAIEAVVSGLSGNVSYSVGAADYHSDGFRPNNNLDQEIYNGFVQIALSPALNVQAEVRKLERDNGDLSRKFDSADFSLVRSEELDASTQRLGLRYQLSPRSDLLISLQKQDRDSRQRDTINTSSTTPTSTRTSATTSDSTGSSSNKLGEMQLLFRSQNYNVVTGIGYFDGSIDNRIAATTVSVVQPLCTLLPAICPIRTPMNISDSTDTRHSTGYSYANIQTSPDISWTLGLSLDSIKNNLVNEHRINPKFGITWNPQPVTTIRAAAFRASKRDLVTDQTIEPTQIAGFNQFFDDSNAADTRRYGFGVDHQFRDVLFGIEFTKRELKIPVRTATGNIDEIDWSERSDRAYLYWAFGENWTATAEYQNETNNRHVDFSNGVLALRTRSIPLALRYYDETGVSWLLRTTYLRQRGSFVNMNRNPLVFTTGKEEAMLVDLELNFRLPKRFGVLTAGIRNLFDKQFQFNDIDPSNPSFLSDRVFYGRVSLNF